ncbi:MAG TPA: hypothetical protein VLF95_13515 [Vicinamibacteria bacterium]|nr:hypothetical protein [Vicinamibacteria bacterium]
MANRLEELHSAVQELASSLHRLEARVGALERRGLMPGEPAAIARGGAAAPGPGIGLPQGTLALLGQTLLVLAGAYVARALTDGRVVPPGVGVALGLAYAVFWQLRADRAARVGRRDRATFLAVTSCVIAFPLLWETTARLGLMGPRAACAALVAFFALGLGVAWRRELAVAGGAVTALALATAVALLLATRDLLAGFVALLAIAAALEWIAYRERWLALRWWAAVALDAVALLLVAIVTRPQGLPRGYVPLPAPVAASAVLALPALYVAGLAARTLRRGRPVTLFEVAQGTLAVLLGFGGAWWILAARGATPLALGVLALLLGGLCYGAAFAFAERRPGQGRNFYFYSTAGALLTLAGASVVAFGLALPFVLGGLGLLGALFGRHFGRMTLRVHSALYLVAGALETGLVFACARAVAGRASGSLPSLAWVAAFAAAGGWAVLATDRHAPRSGWGRAPQLLLATLVVFALGKAVQMGLWAAFGQRLTADPGVAAVLRTAVLAALALGLAAAARRGAWPELGWLVYPLMALGGLKLLLQDLREGRPATLVLSLAIYGAVLVLAPRLVKAADSTRP